MRSLSSSIKKGDTPRLQHPHRNPYGEKRGRAETHLPPYSSKNVGKDPPFFQKAGQLLPPSRGATEGGRVRTGDFIANGPNVPRGNVWGKTGRGRSAFSAKERGEGECLPLLIKKKEKVRPVTLLSRQGKEGGRETSFRNWKNWPPLSVEKKKRSSSPLRG